MAEIRLPHVREVRGRLFFAPTPRMRAAGFQPRPLGPVSDATIAEARRLYAAWRAHLAAEGRPRPSAWPPGSFGHFFEARKRTAAWAKLAARTREDYDRAWPHLAGLAGKTLTRIGVDDCERLADRLQAEHGAHVRYRTMKVLRAVFNDAIPRLRLIGFPNPASAFANPQPRGRSAIWLGAEVARLVETAEAMGRRGMALAIRIAWETLFAPVDVWTLTRAQIRRDGAGAWAERTRTKTGKAAFGALSAASVQAMDAYLASLPFEVPAEGALIRQRNGHAYRSKDTFGDDFREVRARAFPGDGRQFQDLRRSGNLEADLAGASKETMAELLANTIHRNARLDETYTPPTVAKARTVAEQRLEGRRRLAAEVMRARREAGAAR